MREIIHTFKALSDPTRMRIIWLLQARGELCVCDLMEVLDLPQSTVSRHLAYLRNAGLVDDKRKGVWMYYRLPDQLDKLLTGVLSIVQSSAQESLQASADNHRLKNYLKKKKKNSC